jgi:hypothetical protein
VALQRPIVISGTYRLVDLLYLFLFYLDLITLLSNRDYTVSNERVLNKYNELENIWKDVV